METNESGFRLGLIGTGIVGALHIQAAQALPGVTVAAVCDIDADAAGRMAQEAGAVAYTSHEEMLAAEALDGVVITAPHALHAGMTLAAAAAGVHVLVEKPMATSVEDCTAMIDACEAAGVVLAVGHVVRFGALARRAEEVLRSGELGPVRAISQRRTSHYAKGSRPEWFFDPGLAGGGIVMNVGTHGLDRIQWLGGSSVQTVHAHTWSHGDLLIETDAMGFVGLTNGVKAIFQFTSAGLPYIDETVVQCERGALRWSAPEGLWVSRGGKETPLAAGAEEPVDAFAAQLADFTEACRSGRPPRVDGAYGRSVVAAVRAVYDSASSGQPESVAGDLLRSGR
ncbi:Gfo/Idh/MocA family oxidoreductase [Streptomyces sp. TRM66268-LWL]|uniref:Gfo/Idh/MocA family oxidoreductase n=1 Tax=Streptomyces polyasparticus TaxID=2767826 RepID=A0ABR7SIR2_9ACTN|nr:Gfo/Idh/MocA family oxidoreductase [Streptomyces polyasparticus]MBC9715144.1 Gfo/Idh/MocA family oxidoreductase [Streptomyces polyasparticus]